MLKRITIANIGCAHCVHRATSALKSLTNVWKVESSIPNGTLDIETTADDEQLTGTIEKAGFFVKKVETISDENITTPSFYIPTMKINQ